MNDADLIEHVREAFDRHICVGGDILEIRAVAERPTDTRRVMLRASGTLILQGYFLNKTEEQIAAKCGKRVNILIKSDRLNTTDSRTVFEFVVYVG